MLPSFPSSITLTDEQNEVLASRPNLLVSGSAGTGKTLLTVYLADKLTRHEPNSNVVIIILTKSLKAFISTALQHLKTERTKVYHHFEWVHCPVSADYIIVDEAQDFSIRQLQEIKNSSRAGIYLLGDADQQLYDKNLDEQIASLDLIRIELGLSEIRLTKNLRFHTGISDFIAAAYPDISLIAEEKIQPIKPVILRSISMSAQIDRIVSLVHEYQHLGSIGILVTTNNMIPGIVKALMNNSVTNLAFKHERNEQLCFDENAVNVLTCHSAKGLEFDIVILSIKDEPINRLVFCVAFSRAKSRLFLTYADSFPLQIRIDNVSLFEGEIKRPFQIKSAMNRLKFYYQVIQLAKSHDDEYYQQEIKTHSRHLQLACEILNENGFSQTEIHELCEGIQMGVVKESGG